MTNKQIAVKMLQNQLEDALIFENVNEYADEAGLTRDFSASRQEKIKVQYDKAKARVLKVYGDYLKKQKA